MLVTFFLTFFGLCSAKPSTQEYVLLEKNHDVEAWRVEGWEKLERLRSSEEIFLTFALKQSNLESLERIFWEVSDPKSEEYGKHLSLSNLTQLIAPSEATISAVQRWLRSYGVHSSDCSSILTKDFMTCRMSCQSAEAMLVGAKFYRFKHAKLPSPLFVRINSTLFRRVLRRMLTLWVGYFAFQLLTAHLRPRFLNMNF